MIDCTRCELSDECPANSSRIMTVPEKKRNFGCSDCEQGFCPAQMVAQYLDGNKKKTQEAVERCSNRYWHRLRQDLENFAHKHTDLTKRQLAQLQKEKSPVRLFKEKLCEQHGGVIK